VKKGILLGRIIGEFIPAELIPVCYAAAIKEAKRLASNT
jgi:putative ATP-dependent endonuclease of OLD family